MGKVFGTFGVRGVVGKGLDPTLVQRIGAAFGTFLRERRRGKPLVVVGRDTRLSGEALKRALVSGLLGVGAEVLDVGVVPTPVVQFACRYFGVDGGAVITASHNPPEYNGIKLLEPDGLGLGKEAEEELEDLLLNGRFAYAGWNETGRVTRQDVLRPYFEGVKARLDVEAIARRRPLVVADTANGAGSLVLPYLLSELGCRVISVNGHPDGRFPGRNPEPNEENLRSFLAIVRSVGADFGVAQDGDADRSVFADEEGRFVEGDKTFALVAGALLEERGGGLVVTTVATSNVVDEVVRARGGRVLRTKVGDAVVSRALKEHGGLVGGEENGGVIFPDFVLGRDGAMTAAKVLEVFCRRGLRFSELVASLPRFYQLKTKERVEGDRKGIVNLVGELARAGGYRVDSTDGVKILFEDGWVLVRASGTEPIVRIFAEAKEEAQARTYLELGRTFLFRALREQLLAGTGL
ncbi:phosphoglucosamine mutase [Ammonifex thiophilus]|uniref:Phosphoglucosamine mutase n=1 Tax=Ammonifex thiophilus TaxID=444093 RepID=A0A3D8P440_9THEO|nr:phosphoglucosamine mutase [Ammonifex thiophilus]RDV81828.1 phosphoglucosamine mutase [Ammonifex thiophilus]